LELFHNLNYLHIDYTIGAGPRGNVYGNYKNSGHGGGDWALVTDWIKAVKEQDINLLTSTIDASVESHIMGFITEKSRKTKQIISID
tara:strand:- start:403 stop:663 length:261 start_codon:yes stop_codon:yes gene_type:complete